MNLRASDYSGFNADNEAITLSGLGVFGRLEGGPQGNTRLPRKGRGLATIAPDLAAALWRSPRCPAKALAQEVSEKGIWSDCSRANRLRLELFDFSMSGLF